MNMVFVSTYYQKKKVEKWGKKRNKLKKEIRVTAAAGYKKSKKKKERQIGGSEIYILYLHITTQYK